MYSQRFLVGVSVLLLSLSSWAEDSDGDCVPDTVQNIEDKLQVLLSESNQQQQDLDQTLNDLSSLKIGYALLQQDNIEQAEHLQELLWINQEMLWQLERQQEKLDDIDADLQEKAESLQDKLDDIDANLQEKAESLQEKLDDTDAYLQEIAETLEEIESRIHPCGGTSWRRAVFINMTDPNEVCPGGSMEILPDIPVRACGSLGDYIIVNFDMMSETFSKVCGRMQGFQIGGATAFRDTLEASSAGCVHGVTVKRFNQHIWTFAVGSTDGDPTLDTVCPCASDGGANLSPAPEFVGYDYFCESGNKDPTATPGQFYSDTLWDGKNCFRDSECCAFNHPPYFVRDLGTEVSGLLSAEICTEEVGSNIAIQLIEIYVQ